jgi:hypothetical protein
MLETILYLARDLSTLSNNDHGEPWGTYQREALAVCRQSVVQWGWLCLWRGLFRCFQALGDSHRVLPDD